MTDPLIPLLGLPNLSAWLTRLVADKKVPGVIALVEEQGKMLHLEMVGYQNIETQEPIRLDGIFRIASLTKSLTSLLALQLMEKKCFKPNYAIANYLPQFKRIACWDSMAGKAVMARSPISIHQLLTHTSGISYDYNAQAPLRKLFQEAKLYDPQSSLEDFADKLAEIPLNFEPGSRWRYGASTDLLGLVLEKAASTPFDQLLEEHIFRPLALQDTGFQISSNKFDRLVSLYTPTAEGDLRCLESPDTERSKPERRLQSGGGGLYSTVQDYAQVAKLLMNGGMLGKRRLLEEDTLRRLFTNQLAPNILCEKIAPKVAYDVEGEGFGYGFLVRQDGSYGWAGAANTYFWVNPQRQQFSLLFTQLTPFAPYPLQAEFLQAIDDR